MKQDLASGFTLIESLVILATLGVLAALRVFRYQSWQQRQLRRIIRHLLEHPKEHCAKIYTYSSSNKVPIISFQDGD